MRRPLGPAVLLAAFGLANVTDVSAQSAYPTKPIRLIVPSVAGGGTDISTRLQDAAIRKRFLDDGVEPVGSSPEEFAALIRADMAKWAKVVKDAGIKAE